MVWNKSLGFSQLRICRPPLPQLWSHFHERCAMCWNECNFFLRFLWFLFFELLRKFIKNWQFLEQKWWKMTITRKIKIGKIWNLVFLSIQPIADFSCKFDHFWKKLLFLKFTWKIGNRLNRKKNQISNFSFFYFSSYGHFCEVITPIFRDR